MRYFKNVFLTLFVLLTIQGLAQDNTNQKSSLIDEKLKLRFEIDVKAFFQTAVDRDWDAVLDYTYPKMFELQSREKMLEAIRQAYDNKGFTVSLENFKHNNEPVFFTVKDVNLVKVNYSSTLVYKFIKQDQQEDKAFQDYVSYMEGVYQKQFKNATVIRESNQISIAGPKKLLGVYVEELQKWTFLEVGDSSSQLLSILFDSEIAEQISKVLD